VRLLISKVLLANMHLRELGRSGLMVAPLAFGGNVFGWTADDATSFSLLDAFVGGGFNLIDTADVYSRWAPGNQGGESETVIGKWLARGGPREKVVIATKVGMGLDKKGLAKDYILRSVEDSLKRLNTDYIDLYQSHRDDESTPMEETLEAYAQLVKQGKVRAIGASNFSAARLARALDLAQAKGLPVYQSLQPHYNLMERAGYEAELEPLCRERHVGVIPYYSLASGFLTGKYRSEADLSKSPRGGGVKKYLDARGLRVLAALDEVAGRQNSTPTAVSLAWLIARPGITAPIVSATSVAQLRQVMAGAQLKLADADIAAIDAASAA
jgi:aryl-alcohol dehydrogenase-like predicted oxidoreductase